MHLTSIPGAPCGRALPSFFNAGDVLRVIVLVVTMLGRPDAEKKLECVTEIVAVVAIESVGAIVDSDLCAQSDVEAVTVR